MYVYPELRFVIQTNSKKIVTRKLLPIIMQYIMGLLAIVILFQLVHLFLC